MGYASGVPQIADSVKVLNSGRSTILELPPPHNQRVFDSGKALYVIRNNVSVIRHMVGGLCCFGQTIIRERVQVSITAKPRAKEFR